jgi:hypothetical protein
MKTILSIATVILTFVASTTAEARHRHRHYHYQRVAYAQAHPDCNVLWPCAGVISSPRGERIVKAMGGFGSAQKVYKTRQYASLDYRHKANIRPHRRHHRDMPTTSVAGIVSPLAHKVAEIVSNCGSKVISAVRHTYIAGTRHISLHASGKAVDIAGNSGCIYAHLHGWPGGYSVDYGRMRHVHVSYDASGGREMGARFVHGGGHYAHRTRYARYHHRQYASNQ